MQITPVTAILCFAAFLNLEPQLSIISILTLNTASAMNITYSF